LKAGNPLLIGRFRQKSLFISEVKMNNTRAILQINPSENLTLTLQSNPGVGWQWHFTTGSGANGSGLFRIVTSPTARIICRDSQSRDVMVLERIPARAPGSFPFLMEDQTSTRSGNLNVLAPNLPLSSGSYTWTVYQVIP
jgi:hypothetical protein